MLHLRKHAQDQGRYVRRGVTSMLWPGSKVLNALERKVDDLIL